MPRGDKSIVAAALPTILAHSDRQGAGVRVADVVRATQRGLPKTTDLLAQDEVDSSTAINFSAALSTRIFSPSPLKRLSKDFKRQTNIAGVLPDGASLTRLVGTVLLVIPCHARRDVFSPESESTGATSSLGASQIDRAGTARRS